MFKEKLQLLMQKQELSREEAYDCMCEILGGKVTSAQISSFITILSYRGVTTNELIGLTQAMRNHAVTLNLDHTEPIIDTCGTGAGHAKTFNVSTASAIVASSSGLRIAKHGNRAVTSTTGSADVLQELGLPVEMNADEVKKNLEDYRLCFMFAPIYHQAMKYAASTRKEIGFRTVFNLLGPMTNPAGTPYQVIGVFDPQYGVKMAETLKELGSKHVWIVHGEDGLDECSIFAPTRVIELKDGNVRQFTITPEELGLRRYASHSEIQTTSPIESARLIKAVLAGEEKGAAYEIVSLNAGAALYVGQKADSIANGVALAKELIDSSQALNHYQRMTQAEGEGVHA